MFTDIEKQCAKRWFDDTMMMISVYSFHIFLDTANEIEIREVLHLCNKIHCELYTVNLKVCSSVCDMTAIKVILLINYCIKH